MLVVYEYLYTRIPFSWNMTRGTDVARKKNTLFIFKGLKFRKENFQALEEEGFTLLRLVTNRLPSDAALFPTTKKESSTTTP
jgi:hypothetical protein